VLTSRGDELSAESKSCHPLALANRLYWQTVGYVQDATQVHVVRLARRGSARDGISQEVCHA